MSFEINNEIQLPFYCGSIDVVSVFTSFYLISPNKRAKTYKTVYFGDAEMPRSAMVDLGI